MSILSGYKRFKKYLRTADGYKLCSEWTKSDSVEMADGKTLQETISDIGNAVENTQNEVKNVQDDLHISLGGMTFGVDAAGRYGYIKAGADTVTPFKKNDWATLSSENIKEYLWTFGGSFSTPNGFNAKSPSVGQMINSLGIKDLEKIASAKIIGFKDVTCARPGYGGIGNINLYTESGSNGYVSVSINSDATNYGTFTSGSMKILIYIPS